MKTNVLKKKYPPGIFFLPVKFLFSLVGILRLYLDAWWHGGNCEIGGDVRIKSSTLFQGQGTLIVQDGAVFGYTLVGGVNLSIILQPRESDAIIRVGSRTAIMNGCELIALKSIIIGSNCRIGPHTLIYDSDFHDLALIDVMNQAGLLLFFWKIMFGLVHVQLFLKG